MTIDDIDKELMPQHIAIIMDGNRRWAKEKGLDTKLGHKAGAETLEKIASYANEIGLKYLTVYAFSTENWKRTKEEVGALMVLLRNYLDKFLNRESLRNVKIRVLGNIENLDDKKRLQVVHSIATMSSVSPDTIKIVERELEKKFANILTTDYKQVGGIDYIAEVMNNMDRSSEKSIFDGLSEKDAELAEEIRKRMFVFEDITTMDNRSVQRFVRDCDSKDIVFALKGANEEVKSIIFANMSSRMAESIKSDLEITTNVRKKDVEEAQQRIVAIIRRLEEQGELIIMKGGKDDIIA